MRHHHPSPCCTTDVSNPIRRNCRYNLRPASEKKGREVVDHLMKLALLNKKDYVFILAGYQDDISKELYR